MWYTLFAEKMISKRGSVLSLAYSAFGDYVLQFILSFVFSTYTDTIFPSELVVLGMAESEQFFCQQNTDAVLPGPLNGLPITEVLE